MTSFVDDRVDPHAGASAPVLAEVASPLDNDSIVRAFASLDAAVCITDAELDGSGPVITYVSDAYLDLFCCTRDEVLGETPRHSQGELTERIVLDGVRAALEAGRSVRAQVINYRRDGEPFRLRWRIDPVHDHAGGIAMWVATQHDVTFDDRLRRRLMGVDVIRQACVGPSLDGAGPVERIERALVDALQIQLSDIGVATVQTSAGPVTTQVVSDRSAVILGRLTTVEPVAVDGGAPIQVAVHHDAPSLVDRAAIAELAGFAAMLIGLHRG